MTTMINKGILGTKVGMTRVFQENGDAVACTLVEAGPCVVLQVKAADGKDDYDAIRRGRRSGSCRLFYPILPES